MTGRIVAFDSIDSFRAARAFTPSGISPGLIEAVRRLDERTELEPFIRSILTDTGDTPHGPAELVDILTHKVIYRGAPALAAFILKGRSFSTVRPQQVSHQIYRLEKIDGLSIAILCCTGVILDAAKEQFCSTAQRLGCFYSLLDAIDLARLLVAYGFFCPRDARRIVGGRCACGYAPSHRILNLLQEETLSELEQAHRLGQAAGLVVLPTGSGKTRVAAEDARRVNAQRLLYVAHTHEILDVAESEFQAVFGTDAVKRHAKSLRKLSRINIATIQLLRSRHTEFEPGIFDYVVIDEFHHAAAASYRRVLDRLQPDFLLGLTATPFRGDRKDILELCGSNLLISYELRTAIDRGILSPYHYYGCFDNVDYSGIRHNGYRYDIRDLERALIVPERDSAIIQKWIELADGKPTLAFCCSHRHAQRFQMRLEKQGIPSAVYLSTTSRDQRLRLVESHSAGETKVLCVVDVLNEGADFPHVECLLFLRPTESKRIFYQQLGRGLRRYVGKPYCVVIDFIGNFKNAYRIVEYQSLLPLEVDDSASLLRTQRTAKEILNLPLGCQVNFDARVIEIFERQVLDPRYATRHNIARILLFQYRRLWQRLGYKPSRRDVDRNSLLDSRFYQMVFGSWTRFQAIGATDLAGGVAESNPPSRVQQKGRK